MHFKPPKIMTCSKDAVIDVALITRYIIKHQQALPRYKMLVDMYKGENEIFDEQKKPKYKPDNRISVNFAKYIVDTFVGYFNGIPIKKSHKAEEILEAVRQFDNINDMEDEESELAKMTCIYGHCFELAYQNEDAETCVIYNTPEDMFIVYDNTVKQDPLFAVRYGLDEDNTFYGTLYTKDEIVEISGGYASLKLGTSITNPYGYLPITEFILNEERMGIFESVITLINQFNKAISEKSNDVDYFSDQYLAFLGAEVDGDDLKQIRDNRIINYYGRGTEKVDIKFLDKPNSDEETEHLLDRLQKLIFHISMVANISDESFGSASGTSLAYKLEAMSNLALAFQRKYQSALNKRYRLFFSLSTNIPKVNNNQWKDIEYKFTRNEPKNIKDEADTANLLMGVTSEETALSVLSVIPDTKTEMDKIKSERNNKLNIFDFEKQNELKEE